MKYEINQTTYSQLTPLCTVSDDSEVTVECQSPYTHSALSTTSDTVLYVDRQHYNNTQPNGAYVRLAPNTNQQTYSLPNPSISLTSTVPDNHHQLKESEDGDSGMYSRHSCISSTYVATKEVIIHCNYVCSLPHTLLALGKPTMIALGIFQEKK